GFTYNIYRYGQTAQTNLHSLYESRNRTVPSGWTLVATNVTGNTYTDTNVPPGFYNYTITAVDANGFESLFNASQVTEEVFVKGSEQVGDNLMTTIIIIIIVSIGAVIAVTAIVMTRREPDFAKKKGYKQEELLPLPI
ncbi:MAG: hypothetical protein ACTSX4_01975, partial [Candidatus Helarchaeota archaeon]